MGRHFLAMMLATLLMTACSSGAKSPTAASTDLDPNPVASLPEIKVSKDVLKGYQDYLCWADPLAFAVSTDGQHYGYSYCSYPCGEKLEAAEAHAISECNGTQGSARKCAIFAIGRKQPRKYGLATAAANNTASNTRILSNQDELVLTPEVAQEYENCQREMNPLAFAVSSDGRTGYCISCDGIMCLRPSQYGGEAVAGCNDRYEALFGSNDGHCLIFSIGRATPRKYRVASQ